MTTNANGKAKKDAPEHVQRKDDSAYEEDLDTTNERSLDETGEIISDTTDERTDEQTDEE